jgi:hypothetical protein
MKCFVHLMAGLAAVCTLAGGLLAAWAQRETRRLETPNE